MSTRAAAVVRLLAPALLAGCGTRTGLESGAAAAADAAPETAAAADAAADAAPACTWRALGPAERVSGEPIVPGDVALMDAVPSYDGALIAWRTAGTKETPQTIVMRRIAIDPAPNGDEHTIFHAASVLDTVSDVALAVDHGRAGAVATIGGACNFHPITLDGASNGGTVQIDTRACAGLTATASGYDLLVAKKSGAQTTAILRVGLLEGGLPTQANQVLFDEASVPSPLGDPARATWPDGSFLVALRGGDGSLHDGVFEDAGAARARRELAAPSTPIVAVAVAVATAGPGAIVAYSTNDVDAGPSVSALPLAVDGAALGAATSYFAPSRTPISALAAASDPQGGALLAWTQTDARAYVQAVDASAGRRGPEIGLAATLVDPHFAPAIRVVAIGTHGLAIFEAFTSTTPHRIYAVRLGCAP